MDQSLFLPQPASLSVVIANERTKLTATYVNTMAGSIFTVGGLAPIFAILYTATPPALPTPVIAGVATICWITSGTLHLAARRFLKELR